MTSSSALAVPVAAAIQRIDRLHELAEVITREHGLAVEAVRVGLTHAITAGTALLEVKRLLPHGQFRKWVLLHCAVSSRQASTYMRVARAKEKFTSDSTLTLEQALAVVKGADDLRNTRITRGPKCCPARGRPIRKGMKADRWLRLRDQRHKKIGKKLVLSTYTPEASTFTEFLRLEAQLPLTHEYPDVLVIIEGFRQHGPPDYRHVGGSTGSLKLWIAPDTLVALARRLSGMELPEPWSDDERGGAA